MSSDRPASTPQLSVVVVSFNVRDLLRACLQSLRAASAEVALQILVVDNGSADGSAAMVAREFPEAELLDLGCNAGFSAANNRAIERASAPAILLLNPDTEAPPGALPALLAFLEAHPRCGILGPRLLNSDGSFQPSAWPQPTLRSVLRDHWLPPKWRRHAAAPPDAARIVGWVSGAALLTRRSVIDKIGPLDEALFWSEDVDFCRRATTAGCEVWYAPHAALTHHGSRSVPSNRGAVIFYQYRSKAHFFRKHRSRAEWHVLRVMLGIEVSAKLALRALQPKSADRNDRIDAYRRVLVELASGELTTETQRHRGATGKGTADERG
jgi:N-acetylglucosaminyl-diphospho-decaprenol L-rhamnosyltransferase